MAWRYPLYMIQEGYVVDNVAINENLLSVTEETSGYLNEHNFKTHLAADTDYITRSNLKKGAAMKLAYAQGPSVAANAPHSTFNSDGVSVKTPDIVSFSSTDTYQTSNSTGLTLTFTSRGGPTWICASLTLANTTKYLPTYDRFATRYVNRSGALHASAVDDAYFPLPKKKGFGFNLALQLDGVILNDSVIGTADPANEFYNDAEQNISGLYVATKAKAGGGVNGAWNAVVLDTVIDLSPGLHTVKVALMDIRSSSRIKYGEDDNYSTEVYVTSRELFALELTR